jgi:uncharacterized protein YyaL (SSP411 family)
MNPEGPTATGSGNRLGAESSPYLLQHKDNPVDWMAWGDAAFGRAKAEDKPILLSIGYAACHWCHVMAHESFENPATAALMNELFVSVKVDREERPDVDQLYQHALALLGEQGGWPLTMFLTPDGEPFWGGTYFPPDDRYGRPAFPTVLARIAEVYRAEPDRVRQNADALRRALHGLSANQAGGGVTPAVLDEVARQYLRQVDGVHGGLGSAPKFPQCAVFDFLWRAWKRTDDKAFRDAVTITLDRMSQGGIYDHLGGGFARYSTDPVWLAPHFEKMLYDNAQLIALLTLVWQETGSRLYAQRVEETVAWLLREMRVEGGGFAGTLDADSEGEEGKFYVWTKAEIEAVLGDRAAAFCAAYDVRDGGNWEGKTILNRSHASLLGDAEDEAALAADRARLLEARARRVRPGLDDKVLADWNGLAIAALAEAGRVFDRADWVDAARAAFDFVVANMVVNGRLHHTWRNGRAAHPATLDDHAALARAALALFEVTGEPGYLDRAEAWAEAIEALFGDPEAGGYFLSAKDVSDILVRSKTAYDNATPSGNGLMTELLARLHHLTGKPTYRDRADTQIRAFSGELQRNALAIPVLLGGAELLDNAVQIVVCGAPGDVAADELERAAWRPSVPNRAYRRIDADQALPEGHPAHGKGLVDGRAAAYVCRGSTCTLPITEPDALVEELTRY